MATMDTGLKPAIFVGVALFAMRDLCPLTGGRSPGKYLMGVDVHTVDEVNKPRTKAGKLQRCAPTEASVYALTPGGRGSPRLCALCSVPGAGRTRNGSGRRCRSDCGATRTTPRCCRSAW